ncbi:DNA internalization-related competence protein ComEC/Rec2 [Celerinatantimonas sp. YJH-8]|uniref:DNA internalization-related competence protein ComEC/Rec2 n=1 Tax=Celerinatantimonas sp. YJH-8 TaxID=3228714 RepID=UPI0038C8B403
MKYFLIGWLFTLMSSLIWPTLPSVFLLMGCLVVSILCIKHYPFVTGCCLALCWLSWQAHTYQKAVYQLSLSGRYHSIEGTVTAVSKNTYRQHFLLKINQIDQTTVSLFSHRMIRLSQYHRNHQPLTDLNIGDRVLVRASLKPAHASLDQGIFNYQRALVAQNIIALGTTYNITIQTVSTSYRSQLIKRLQTAFQNIPQASVMQALTTGIKSDIPYRERQLWMQAGVGHLLAISGLHLGILAFWGGLLGRLCSRFLPFKWRIWCEMLGAILCALGYGSLAGWPVSAQRAMIMLLIWLMVRRCWLWISHLDCWLIAIFGVTLLWPLSILSGGLWLSFGAILLIYFLLWLCPWSGWRRLLFLQMGLWIGLLPLQVSLFGYISWLALPLNLVAIPLFSFVIIPLLLLGVISLVLGGSFATLFFSPVGIILSLLNKALFIVFAQVPVMVPVPKATGLLFSLILIIGLCGLAKPHRRWWIALSIWLLWPAKPALLDGWWVHFLDVGQGLAVVVESNHHAILYDTAARYPSGFSYARSVIQPFLMDRGDLTVDKIILSHADNDHAGGYPFLRRHYPEAQVIRGADPRFKTHNCQGNYHWQQLVLTLIQPEVVAGHVNDQSCMLLISDGFHRILLTGDIEKDAEDWWVLHRWQQVDGISVPHHGSQTSSSSIWLKQLQPHWAVASSGFLNAYHLPAASVVERYRKLHIPFYNTAMLGQVSVHLYTSGSDLVSYRKDIAPFWYNRGFLLENSHGSGW